MSKARVKVIKESSTGRNERFLDTLTNQEMTRNQFVKAIDKGVFGDEYYHREINGVETPVSKPDGIKKNNLG